MAIELNWGRYGYQPAWTAMKLYRSIYLEGKRVRIPDLETIPTFTEKDVAFRARVPFADAQYNDMFSGLRSIDAAAADAEDLILNRAGEYVTNVQVGNEYDIDEQGLADFMEFEFDRALDRQRLNTTPSAALHYLRPRHRPAVQRLAQRLGPHATRDPARPSRDHCAPQRQAGSSSR